ncbi:MAG: RNA polymerase sigma factor RpoE [Thiotrichaceae bacterium]|nr:RNA polymerase sigma factor RpoE [Thiotrichaceae bacterium]
MGNSQTDLELVRLVQAGEKKAFDVLVLKYQQKVINIVMRYVRDQSTANDISQETFIKAYRGLKNFRGDSAFYTWLYRIAINTAKNHLVTMKRRLPLTDIDAQQAEQYDSATSLREIASPENELQKDEVHQAIIKSVQQLPDDLRTAISLREIEGFSYEEIAEAMGCPIGTVRSRIFRAREAIEEHIAPYMT